MLTQITKTQNNSEEIYYYHNDHLGTPKVMTSQAGNVVWEAIYQPFGEIDRYLNAKVSNYFRFPGQYEDELTGLYYNHYRYYISYIGRYSRPDLLFLKSSKKVNFYIYAKNNTLVNLDIEGLQEWGAIALYSGAGSFHLFCNCCIKYKEPGYWFYHRWIESAEDVDMSDAPCECRLGSIIGSGSTASFDCCKFACKKKLEEVKARNYHPQGTLLERLKCLLYEI